jgi:hypothetical protein
MRGLPNLKTYQMSKLSSSLVLNKYILKLFGATDLEAFSTDLKDSTLEGYDENNVSYLHHALVAKLFHNELLTKEMLLAYDVNIFAHTQKISDKRHEPIIWKYFQYLALLFTEIYLDKYFTDKTKLLNDLNSFLQLQHGNYKNDFSAVTKYEVSGNVNDINKLAYWNATGSGKTLIMHINILQYQNYLKTFGKTRDLNRIIVLTPNEGLSRQHLKEFADSGLEAELFDKNAGSMFIGQKIEIIDIHKLEETSGDKTVAVEAFEGNNLVLVDEGHRGSGGESWKGKRNRICETGFSFEYSATFGQAVSALTGKKQKDLLNEYSKATLFDYSYRYFYNDGYGKDYQILNLDQKWDQGYVDLYLTACLLSFYEQLLVFKENTISIEPFLVEKPLAIFVGGKVTQSINDQTASDVVEVLKFLEGFVRNNTNTIGNIKRILEDRTGLNNENGNSIFANSFGEIRRSGRNAAAIYEDLLLEVFNAKVAGAYLHIDNLKGQPGEIGLRIGNEPYFGVINVGDDKKLLSICKEKGISTDEYDFSESLFHKINDKHSKINILIGSKKFSEGWSSWRVSTMGLLNIGRGEGSEIIQLFGRGVRLKGYKFSLKRSSKLDMAIRPVNIPKVLPLLETLNIFGLRADYMQQFKDYLEEEGLPTNESDFEKITLNVLPTLKDIVGKNLKYIKVKDDVNFKRDYTVNLILNNDLPVVTLDWYPKVQVLKSSKTTSITQVQSIDEGTLSDEHLAFLDWNALYFDVQKFKNQRSWYNLDVSLGQLKDILETQTWYTLYIPKAELEHNDFSKVRLWQEVASSLLKAFIEKWYNFQKSMFYSDKLETAYMDATHPNLISEYRVQVLKTEERLIENIKALKTTLQKGEFSKTIEINNDFAALYNQLHLYQPLIYLESSKVKNYITLQPIGLNEGEKGFLEDLKKLYDTSADLFEDKEVFLLRNTSKKGIGFFEANGNFFPDFILWIIKGNKQFVTFIDPKGLRQLNGFDDPKIQLHKTIKSVIEANIKDTDIALNSFIISNTPFNELLYWRGQNSMADFNDQHVLFQKDQKNYIRVLLDKIGFY